MRYLRTVVIQLGLLGALGIAFMFGIPQSHSQSQSPASVQVQSVTLAALGSVDAFLQTLMTQITNAQTDIGTVNGRVDGVVTTQATQQATVSLLAQDVNNLKAQVAALQAGAPPPVTTPPVTTPPPATGSASPDGTQCQSSNPSCTVVDSSGTSWAFSSTVDPKSTRGSLVMKNGVLDTNDAGVTLEINAGGKAYIKTNTGTWWGGAGFTKSCGQVAIPAC